LAVISSIRFAKPGVRRREVGVPKKEKAHSANTKWNTWSVALTVGLRESGG